MCGIVGFVDKKIADKKPVIEAMMDTIKHRGPNSSGELVNEDTALGFRRLSIIDINSGMQPIYNEDKSKAVIFNGEIYNSPAYLEFRRLKHSTREAPFCYQKGPSTFGMEILSNTKNSRPN
jgi:asparagine synthetase B (glutamine-hydrolysing)